MSPARGPLSKSIGTATQASRTAGNVPTAIPSLLGNHTAGEAPAADPHCLRSARRLLDEFDSILFNYGVRKHILGDLFNFHTGLGAIGARFQRNFEILALTHRCNSRVTEA